MAIGFKEGTDTCGECKEEMETDEQLRNVGRNERADELQSVSLKNLNKANFIYPTMLDHWNGETDKRQVRVLGVEGLCVGLECVNVLVRGLVSVRNSSTRSFSLYLPPSLPLPLPLPLPLNLPLNLPLPLSFSLCSSSSSSFFLSLLIFLFLFLSLSLSPEHHQAVSSRRAVAARLALLPRRYGLMFHILLPLTSFLTFCLFLSPLLFSNFTPSSRI
jgi:hypothetical protein